MPKTERRSFHFELRTEAAGDKKYLVGRAASYNVMSKDLGFREIIANGAFDDVLADRDADIVCNVNHDSARLLGRTSAQTLRLSSDATGLHYRCMLPATTYASDLAELCTRGDVSQSSFAFSVDAGDDEWTLIVDPDSGAKVPLRTIHRIAALYDVSVVTTAAYPSTSAALSDRSLPTSMPAEMRSLLVRGAAVEEPDQQCECDCPQCVDGDHAECSNQTCQDEQCEDAGCPAQQTGNDRAVANARKLAIAEAAL